MEEQRWQFWLERVRQAEKELQHIFSRIDDIAFENQRKVLESFWENQVTDFHLQGATGYGYDHQGRDTLDKIYAQIFRAPSALVRSQLVSGTHAIGAALFAAARPKEKMLSVTGTPYDTLEELIGFNQAKVGSLASYGVGYQQVELASDGKPDLEAIREVLQQDHEIKLVFIQRSRGYSWRSSLTIADIEQIIAVVKGIRPEVVVIVDNCYGEFTEAQEPTAVGADLAAGSLIKNLGGGIAPSGGYVVGREDLVELAAQRLTMPGLGSQMGAISGDTQRSLYQGIFLAPHVVGQAVKGMHLFAYLLDKEGYEVSPHWSTPRTDIIQAVRFPAAEPLIAFCQSIQQSSPIDAHVLPESWQMPGYQDPVIMAAGTFIQGASIELSADAPIRLPFTAYLQGGLTYEHVKLAAIKTMARLKVE